MVHLAICCPTPALRAGLRTLITAGGDLVVDGSAPDLASLEPLDLQVSVLVATSGVLGAEEALPERLAVLLVSDDPEEARELAGRQSGAWGVISPEATAEALQAAVLALAEGMVVISPEMHRALCDPATPGEALAGARLAEPLTAREVEVLRCLAQGLTNKQAALALQISEHTVKFHVSAIYGKLGVSNRAEAVREGARAGLVPL